MFLCLKNTWARCAPPFSYELWCRITKHLMNKGRAWHMPPVAFAHIRAWPRFRTPHCIYEQMYSLLRRLPFFSVAAAGPHRRALWDYISSPTRPRCQPCWDETPKNSGVKLKGLWLRARLGVLCCTSESRRAIIKLRHVQETHYMHASHLLTYIIQHMRMPQNRCFCFILLCLFYCFILSRTITLVYRRLLTKKNILVDGNPKRWTTQSNSSQPRFVYESRPVESE